MKHTHTLHTLFIDLWMDKRLCWRGKRPGLEIRHADLAVSLTHMSSWTHHFTLLSLIYDAHPEASMKC